MHNHTEESFDVSYYLDRVREGGFKVTAGFKAVIKLFMEEKSCMGPLDVHKKLQNDLPTLGLPTVYRILERLNKVGVMPVMMRPDRQLYYFLCGQPDSGHHHHFICRDCSRVEELDFCNFDELNKRVKNTLNGTALKHFLQIEGICSKCG